jgi:hypothetical protein
MSDMSEERDREEREEHARALELAEAAKAALDNRAVAAYFETAERQMIDAWVACEDRDLAERLRLSVGVIRNLRRFLKDGVEAGKFAAEMINRIDEREEARR